MKTSLSKIAQLVEGDIIGSSSLMIRGAAPFDMADENQITVAGVAKYLKALDATAAGAILVPRNIQTAKQPLVQVDNPMVAFAKVMHYFHPPQKPEAGIHPSASIGHEVQIGHEVCIGPMAVIGNRVIDDGLFTYHFSCDVTRTGKFIDQSYLNSRFTGPDQAGEQAVDLGVQPVPPAFFN